MDKRIKNIIFDFGGVIVDLDKQAAIHAFEALGFDARAYINEYVQGGAFALLETGEISPEEFCTYVRKIAGKQAQSGAGACSQAPALPSGSDLCKIAGKRAQTEPRRSLPSGSDLSQTKFSGLALPSGSDLCKEAGTEALRDEEIFRAWNKMLVGIPARRIQAIRDLRTNYRTYMLSNTNAIHWAYSCRELMAPAGLKAEDCFDRIFLSFQMHLAKPDERIFRRALTEAGLKPEETLFVDDSYENCRTAERLGMQVFHSRKPDDWLHLDKSLTLGRLRASPVCARLNANL